MIKITPYYENRANGEAILKLYLETVADVVPFLPEDVLGEYDTGNNGKFARRRDVGDGGKKKDSPYVKLLKHYGLTVNGSNEEKRVADAKLAGVLIQKYSTKLYDYLYDELTDEEKEAGHVNKDKLRNLLTVRMEDGVLPDTFDFRNPKASKKSQSDLLKYVFRYDAFSAKDNIYRILQLLGVDVCPYCNRQYITTYSPKITDETDQDAKAQNTETEDDPDNPDPETAKTRAQLDHFKAKSIYPFLALSINNLVPSCAVCNHMKSDKTEETLYPYSEGLEDKYVFSTDIPEQEISFVLLGTEEASKYFNIKLGPADKNEKIDPNDPFYKRMAASKQIFGLEGLYQAHKNYVANLYYQRYVFTQDMVDELAERYKPVILGNMKLGISPEKEKNLSDEDRERLEIQRTELAKKEIYKMLLLMDTDQNKTGDRPLAKLTRDIKAEIDREYKKIPPNRRDDKLKK